MAEDELGQILNQANYLLLYPHSNRAVEDDGKGFIRDDVTEKEGDEYPVLPFLEQV